MRFFANQLKLGLVGERGLLGFGQPRFAERLQAGQVIGGDGIGSQNRRVEGKFGTGGIVQFAGYGQIFGFLKDGNGRAGLRAEGTVNGARRDQSPGQGDLSLQDIMNWSREI